MYLCNFVMKREGTDKTHLGHTILFASNQGRFHLIPLNSLREGNIIGTFCYEVICTLAYVKITMPKVNLNYLQSLHNEC